jgi:hypothetical protein
MEVFPDREITGIDPFLDHQPEKEFTFQQTWGFPNPTKWSR